MSCSLGDISYFKIKCTRADRKGEKSQIVYLCFVSFVRKVLYGRDKLHSIDATFNLSPY